MQCNSLYIIAGFVGFQLNYRLGLDNGSFPITWPGFEQTGGAGLGLQPPIPAGAPLFESQRFVSTAAEGGHSLNYLTLASDSELCVIADAPGGSVEMKPCLPSNTTAASNRTADNNNTVHWRTVVVEGEWGSVVGVGGAFDGKCLGTLAPDPEVADKRAFVAKMASRCNSADPAQRWQATGLGTAGGGTLCRPNASGDARARVGLGIGPGFGLLGAATAAAAAVPPPVDDGCLSFAGGFNPPVPHLYPAVRDAKAAVRWLRAIGAPRFNVDPSYITLDGGSAGACTILGAGTYNDS